jgi:hypothetical protein
LRDPKNKAIPLFLQIPQNSTQVPLKDQNLYKNMLRELDETESMIWESDASKDNSTASDYIMSFKIIIDGCRSMVFAQSGYADQAVICAEKCIRDTKSLQARVSYWALPVTLAYSLQVVKTLNNQALFNEGLPLLSLYADNYPIVNQMIQILSSKNLENNPALDLSLTGLASAPFAIPGVPVSSVSMGVAEMPWFPHQLAIPGVPVTGLLPGMFTNVMPGLVSGTLMGLPMGLNTTNLSGVNGSGVPPLSMAGSSGPQTPHNTPEAPPIVNMNGSESNQTINMGGGESPENKSPTPIMSLPLPIIPPHN